MASTYEAIMTYTVPSAQSSYTFTSISQDYTDLVLVANTIVSSGVGYELGLQFNGDTGSNYSDTYLLGDGTSATSGRQSLTFADCGYLASNSGNPNTRIINLQNYSNTTTYKTVLSRGSSVNSGQAIAYVNLWRNTSAISSIKIFSNVGLNYAAGSTFTLYGIKAA